MTREAEVISSFDWSSEDTWGWSTQRHSYIHITVSTEAVVLSSSFLTKWTRMNTHNYCKFTCWWAECTCVIVDFLVAQCDLSVVGSNGPNPNPNPWMLWMPPGCIESDILMFLFFRDNWTWTEMIMATWTILEKICICNLTVCAVAFLFIPISTFKSIWIK